MPDHSNATLPNINWNEIIAQVIVKQGEIYFSAISGTLRDQAKKAKIRFATAFSAYLNNALEKYSKVKTLLYRNEPRSLYEFYEFNDVCHKDNGNVPCDHIDTLLNISRFNIILGDGGSGKSMLMRHFFCNALQESDRIPIFVELRYIDSATSLGEYIFSRLSSLGFDLEYAYFEYALAEGMFTILLDGYDEIKSSARETFFDRLDSFCDQYSDNCFIISSRKSDTFIGWHRFTVYDICPLSKTRALNMIKKLDYDEETKGKFLTKLEQELYDSHKSFASNPLLLSIMLMTFDQYAEIPEKLHVFYSYAFDTLYSMHDATKGGYKRELTSKLTSDQFKMVFSIFCFRTYLVGKHQFSKDELLKEISKAGEKISGFDSISFFNDIQIAVCLICEDGRDYQFTHRSFQEYFTAVFLNSLDDAKQDTACDSILRSRPTSITTDKVFDMLKDMSEDRFEKNYIIPRLKEFEQLCPDFPSKEQCYFYGLVETFYISSNLEKVADERDFDLICAPFGNRFLVEKRLVFLFVKCCCPKFAHFIPSLSRYYNNTLQAGNKKLATEHWEKEYTPETIWNDQKLRTHFMHNTELGCQIRFASTLLSKFEAHHTSKDAEFQKMLDAIFQDE